MYKGAFIAAAAFAGGGSLAAAVPRALPGAACLTQEATDSVGQGQAFSSACSVLGAHKAAGILTRCP